MKTIDKRWKRHMLRKPVWRWDYGKRAWVNHSVSVAGRVVDGVCIYWTLPDW